VVLAVEEDMEVVPEVGVDRHNNGAIKVVMAEGKSTFFLFQVKFLLNKLDFQT
jgi:hypothetical protein